MRKIAVIAVFYDSRNNKFLVENRTKEQLLAGEKVFPGGKMEEEDLDNLETALRREIKEELEIDKFDFIDLKKEIRGINGYTMHQFLITSWKGKLPDRTLDRGAKLEWVDIDKFKSRVKPIERVAEMIRAYVAQS